MYKQCFSEQSAKRQRELEAGLLAAMVTQRYEDITISDLCGQMGIPRKCFYRYFSGKDGALYALIDHTIMDFTGAFFTGELEGTIATLERFFLFWKERHQLLEVLERSDLTGVLIQRSIARTIAEDLLPQRNFYHQKQLPQGYMIIFLISGLLSMVLLWHQGGYKEPVSQLALAAAQLLTQPLISRGPTSEII